MAKSSALSDAKIKNAKAKEKPYKLFDSGGLFLLVHTSGGKWWRFKYRFDSKDKKLSLGTYPEIALGEAREKCFEMRKQVANGVDPSAIRKKQKAENLNKAGNTFEVIAREWHNNNKERWTPKYIHNTISLLETRCFPDYWQ